MKESYNYPSNDGDMPEIKIKQKMAVTVKANGDDLLCFESRTDHSLIPSRDAKKKDEVT
jgi:hypothetical protein